MQSLSKTNNRVLCGAVKLLIAALVSILEFPCVPARAEEQSGLARWVAAPHRTAGNVARDGFRHPLETLTFFGIKKTALSWRSCRAAAAITWRFSRPI